MGFYEETVLYPESFAKAVTDPERAKMPRRQKYTSSISPRGMFETEQDSDIFNGKKADGFFELMNDEEEMDIFIRKIELFRQQSLAELEEE